MSQRESGKLCSRCGEEFPRTAEFFQVDRHKPDGLRPDCKACRVALRQAGYLKRRDAELMATRAYRAKNANYLKQKANEWFQRNKEHCRAKTARQRARNPEAARDRDRRWVKANPGRNAAKAAFARSVRRQATPQWLRPEHRRAMREVYLQAAELGGHDVDHVVPLRGVEAWGLHVPWNLQILTSMENRKKGNRLVAA